MSTKKTSHTPLFSYLEEDLNTWDYASLTNGEYIGISWISGQSKRSKTVRWFTNLALDEEKEVQFYNKVNNIFY